MHLSRLQASLDVAARVVAPSEEAFDVQLQQHPSLHALWTCYPALRRLPGRDSHPLEKCSLNLCSLSVASVRHGAPCTILRRTTAFLPRRLLGERLGFQQNRVSEIENGSRSQTLALQWKPSALLVAVDEEHLPELLPK